MEIYDISIPVQPSLAVWPGDTPYALDWKMRLDTRAPVNLSSVTMSLHIGSHVDAPYHFLPDGATIDLCDLHTYCGAALVVELIGYSAIRLDAIRSIDLQGAQRVLFKTLAWTEHSKFPATIPVMEADVPAYLQSQGVILIGVDVPSVDEIESKDLPNHHSLAARGIAILESLDLRAVSAGSYELLALPLKLVGADGSPVRAILRR